MHKWKVRILRLECDIVIDVKFCKKGLVYKFAIWEHSVKWHSHEKSSKWPAKIFKFVQKLIVMSCMGCHLMTMQ